MPGVALRLGPSPLLVLPVGLLLCPFDEQSKRIEDIPTAKWNLWVYLWVVRYKLLGLYLSYVMIPIPAPAVGQIVGLVAVLIVAPLLVPLLLLLALRTMPRVPPSLERSEPICKLTQNLPNLPNTYPNSKIGSKKFNKKT